MVQFWIWLLEINLGIGESIDRGAFLWWWSDSICCVQTVNVFGQKFENLENRHALNLKKNASVAENQKHIYARWRPRENKSHRLVMVDDTGWWHTVDWYYQFYVIHFILVSISLRVFPELHNSYFFWWQENYWNFTNFNFKRHTLIKEINHVLVKDIRVWIKCLHAVLGVMIQELWDDDKES